MNNADLLYVESSNVVKPDGAQLEDGNYDVNNLANISATYQLTDKKITVSDDGDLDGESNSAIMNESPIHHSLLNGNFVGEIRLKDVTLVVENNEVIGTK